jgi:putative redox protein
LAAGGVAVCRFDFTGLGESGGEFARTNFTSNLEDLLAATEFLRGRFQAPQLLIGHSLGGAAILAVASRIPEARAVVTIAAPSDTEHLSRQLLRMAPELAGQSEATVTIAGRAFQVQRQLLADLDSHRMSEYLRDLDRPLLVLHSPLDEVVDVENAMRIFQQAGFPKSFVSVDGADHLLAENREDWQFVADVIESWSRRYLASGVDKKADGRDEVEKGQVLVRGGAKGYATEISAGGHALRADEPVALGGSDSGPNPYSFLLASLGACKVITMRMYADRKGWPLRGSQVEVAHSRIHAKDCEDCESSRGRVDRIEVVVDLEGDLSQEQSRRLVEISERCPVHRTLTNEVSIRTTTV